MPAAGYEIDLLRVRGLDRGATRCAPPARCDLAARRGPGRAPGAARARRRGGARRRRLRRRPGRGSRRSALGLPLVLTEADRHLGLTNRLLARRARRVCLAFPIDGPARATATWSPAARSRRRSSHADRDAGPRRASGSPPPTAACSSSAAARAPARSTSRARGLRRAPTPASATSTSSTSAAAATTPTCARALDAAPNADRYTLLEYEPGLADALAASRPRARPLGRLDLRDRRRRPPVDPGPLSARGGAPPARERRAGWPTPGAAVVVEDSELEPGARCAALAGELLGDAAAARRDGRARRARSPAPTPPSGSRPSCSPRSATLSR